MGLPKIACWVWGTYGGGHMNLRQRWRRRKAALTARRPMSRSESRAVACPYCYALKGERCKGTRGPREASHQERVNRAREARA